MYYFNNFVFTAVCSSGVGSYVITLNEIRNNERTRTFLRILISFIEIVNRILKKKCIILSLFCFTVICNSHTTLFLFLCFPI